MRLSLLAIVQNEAEIVERWAQGFRRIPSIFDSVVVIDGGSTDDTVTVLERLGLTPIVRQFPTDFADQRNFGIDQTAGEWIFELDADEVVAMPLLGGLRQLIDDADKAEVDCIGIPRLNFHDHVLQPGPGYRGLDFQYRLHRRHCRWRNPVHEEISGFKRRVELDIGDGHFIQHLKTAARYDERNAYYRSFAG